MKSNQGLLMATENPEMVGTPKWAATLMRRYIRYTSLAFLSTVFFGLPILTATIVYLPGSIPYIGLAAVAMTVSLGSHISESDELEVAVPQDEFEQMTASERIALVLSLYVIVSLIITGTLGAAGYLGFIVAGSSGSALFGIWCAILYPYVDRFIGSKTKVSFGILGWHLGVLIVSASSTVYGLSDEVSREAEDLSSTFVQSRADV